MREATSDVREPSDVREATSDVREATSDVRELPRLSPHRHSALP